MIGSGILIFLNGNAVAPLHHPVDAHHSDAIEQFCLSHFAANSTMGVRRALYAITKANRAP